MNEKIGRVGDMLLRKEDLSVYALISHDSHFKERLEAIGILNDRDEIIPLHHIDRENLHPNQISTKIKRNKLRTTDSKWEIPEDYFMFSKLCKLEVLDKDGDSVGHITDIIYHEHDEYSIVIDPATYIQHFLEVLHIRHHHEIILPSDFIASISDQVNLTIDREEIEKIDALPIHMVLDKNKSSHGKKAEKPKKRYHYKVLQAPLYVIKDKFQEKGQKLVDARQSLKIIEFNPVDDEQIEEFVTLFNEVAMTSVDPFEQLTREKVQDHFGKGSYLAYYHNSLAGYCITTENLSKRSGAIAGIGIHHKFRGKRLSTALMAEVVDVFDKKALEFVECDVLNKNEASLGLFYGLGFKEIDDFYLS